MSNLARFLEAVEVAEADAGAAMQMSYINMYCKNKRTSNLCDLSLALIFVLF